MPNETNPEGAKTAEELRLDEAREKGMPWKQWGPYLSERQWGTVREDYSENGDAWNYFTHDQARSRAYHWGEDGLAGFSDDHQRLCFALALWNGKDPILKERLFGLTNSEGNHGEDVKEYYFYLDSTPTHSYMKYLYKYPQNAYPYSDSIETNRRRGRNDWEYELLDTGIFNEDRYFDVFVEYAKAEPDRHPDPNQRRESWARGGVDPRAADPVVPQHLDMVAGPAKTLLATEAGRKYSSRSKRRMPSSVASCCIATEIHGCCSPKTTPTTSGSSARPTRRPTSRTASTTMSWSGRQEAVNPNQTGTKAAAHYQLNVGAGETAVIRLRLSNAASRDPFGSQFNQIIEAAPARG